MENSHQRAESLEEKVEDQMENMTPPGPLEMVEEQMESVTLLGTWGQWSCSYWGGRRCLDPRAPYFSSSSLSHGCWLALFPPEFHPARCGPLK